MKHINSTPIFQFHCLSPGIFFEATKEIPSEIRQLVAEYVCDQLCKIDTDFAQEYLERLFTPEKYNPYRITRTSGMIEIFTLEHMTYYCAEQKSWKRIPPVSKLKFWKEIKELTRD